MLMTRIDDPQVALVYKQTRFLLRRLFNVR